MVVDVTTLISSDEVPRVPKGFDHIHLQLTLYKRKVSIAIPSIAIVFHKTAPLAKPRVTHD